jgi:hypothetical protein
VILSLEAPNKFGKSIPEFGETHSSVLGCESRPVSASIMGRSCFASFFSFSFSSHYLNNIIFIDNSLGPLATESPCRRKFVICAVHSVSLREPTEEDGMSEECGMHGRKDKFV